MRTVFLVTRHPDVARLVPALERAGLAVEATTPDRLATDEPEARAGAAVLDLRDIPATSFNLVLNALAEHDVVVVALVPGDQLELISVDCPIDDFLVLPAAAAELTRRVERAIWRRHGVDSENYVRCGALTIDLANYRVTVDGEPLVMTFKEYELLRFLAMNAGRVFTREQLLNRVWGYDYFGGARTVDVHIRRIRSKVEIHGHAFIETVRNVGYRLVAEARTDEVGE